MYAREIERVLVFLARRTLDVTIAADLAAETFAIAFRGWPRLQGRTDEEVRAWLFTVARRQVSRYLRSARAEQRAVRRLGIQVPVVDEDEIELIEERAGLVALRAEVSAWLMDLNTRSTGTRCGCGWWRSVPIRRLRGCSASPSRPPGLGSPAGCAPCDRSSRPRRAERSCAHERFALRP